MIRRALLWVLVAILLAGGFLWLFGPREPVDLTARFDAAQLPDDLDAYLATREAVFDDITPGAEKRIRWQGAPGQGTDWAIVYLHGFSATSRETHPLTDRLADAIGANVVYTRLAGHGRTGAALGGASVADWAIDLDEALAIADRIGDRTLVIGVSTGATLAVAGFDEGRGADAFIAVSPNFRIANPQAEVLTMPAARQWVPMLFGRERAFASLNDDHATWWTSRYPTTALFPMAALVKRAQVAGVEGFDIPALFVFDDADTVVDHRETRAVAARWGGPATIAEVKTGEGDDPGRHVIAGDILSPGMTDDIARLMTAWVRDLR